MKKRCSKCGQTKPLDEFCKDSRRRDGRGSHCKVCHRASYKKRPVAQPLNPGDEKQCSSCKETKPVEQFDKSIRYRTGYISQCRECRLASSRQWKRKNRERLQQYQLEWRALHPEYFQEYMKKMPKHKKEQVLERRRQWSKTPIGRAWNIHSHAMRRAAEKIGDVTPEYLLELFGKIKLCHYCHRPFTDDLRPTIDHVVPLSKNGTHTKDNIVLACQPCNSSKSNKYPY